MRPSTVRCPRLVVIAACLTLGGCVSALDLARPDPPRLFDLTPKSTFDDGLPSVDGRLDIEIPTATVGLNTAKIALRLTPTRLEYYARARWVDVVPVMVQTLLQESFDNSGRIDVLARNAFGLRADYALLITVREFQADYQGDDPPEVRVHLQARLLRLPRRTTLAETSSPDARARAADTSLQSIVSAFDDAFGKAAKDVVEWTVQRIAEAEASGS